MWAKNYRMYSHVHASLRFESLSSVWQNINHLPQTLMLFIFKFKVVSKMHIFEGETNIVELNGAAYCLLIITSLTQSQICHNLFSSLFKMWNLANA